MITHNNVGRTSKYSRNLATMPAVKSWFESCPGTYSDRIVHRPDEEKSVAQARLALRVAVSRAKRRGPILTLNKNVVNSSNQYCMDPKMLACNC